MFCAHVIIAHVGFSLPYMTLFSLFRGTSCGHVVALLEIINVCVSVLNHVLFRQGILFVERSFPITSPYSGGREHMVNSKLAEHVAQRWGIGGMVRFS